MSKTPLTDAQVLKYAERADLDPTMVDRIDVRFARRLEKSHNTLLKCVQWALVNNDECLGDWPKMLERFHTALITAEGLS